MDDDAEVGVTRTGTALSPELDPTVWLACAASGVASRLLSDSEAVEPHETALKEEGERSSAVGVTDPEWPCEAMSWLS